MAKVLITLAAVASFLVVPALCVGGMITHACDCPTDPPACHTDCGHEVGCGHEGECPDDPCSVRVVRPQRHNDDVVTISHTVVSTSIILTAVTQPSLKTDRAGAQQWSGGGRLPFLPGDLPLLV